MNTITHKIIIMQMADTLVELNGWFCKHDSITKDKFMDLQLKCWNKLKENLTKHNNDFKKDCSNCTENRICDKKVKHQGGCKDFKVLLRYCMFEQSYPKIINIITKGQKNE